MYQFFIQPDSIKEEEIWIADPQDESMRVALIVQEEMENAVKMSVPLTADAAIGRTWYDAKG